MDAARAGLLVTEHSPPRWAWVLQDILGIAFCLYMLRTIRLPTFKVRAASECGRLGPGWRSGGLGTAWGVITEAALIGPLVPGSRGPDWVTLKRFFTGLHTVTVGAVHL